jgi:hypothetical protein
MQKVDPEEAVDHGGIYGGTTMNSPHKDQLVSNSYVGNSTPPASPYTGFILPMR